MGRLPAQPTGRYAARPLVYAMLAVGSLALAVCGTYTGLWLASHWVPVGGRPGDGVMAVLMAAAVGVLWLAGRRRALE